MLYIGIAGALLLSSCGNDELFPGTIRTVNGYTTVSDIRPGQLKNALGVLMLTVSKLAIDDTINSRDFRTMRDEMPFLNEIDLSKATIVGYHGFDGTAFDKQYYYPDNTIPEFAFYNPSKSTDNTRLQSIILPENIRSIGDYAFNRCVKLSGNFSIPPSVTDTIGKSAFSFCTGLTGIQLSAARYIGESAFQGCSSLSGTVVIPDSAITISDWAFAYCSSITQLSIPSTLSYFGRSVCEGCTQLSSIQVDAKNTAYSYRNGLLIDNGSLMLKFGSVSLVGSLTLPSDLQFIDNAALSNCSGLTSVVIPASVLSIGDRTFYNCTALTSVYVLSDSPVDLTYTPNAFETVDVNKCVLHVPTGTASTYRQAGGWKNFVNIVEN